MKNKKYDTVGKIPKSNIKIVERDKIDNPIRHIHNRSLFWLGIGTLIIKWRGKASFMGPSVPS
jgi:hypothetical protein